MMKKMKNKKGFTLMEMLIVVAIIAVLIVIAIPTFNNALAKSRAATDLANIRSGYASAQVRAMTEGLGATNTKTYTLKADGSVSAEGDTATTAADYTCKGDSKNVTEDTTVGGVVTVGTGKTLNWTKGQEITYVVTETDGLFTVTITPTTANNG